MMLDMAVVKSLFPALAPIIKGLKPGALKAIEDQAVLYMGTPCNSAAKDHLLMLMFAHLLYLQSQVASGGGLALTSASMGGVSVSMSQPARAGARAIWLNSTPYGQQYAALEDRCSRGRAAAGLFFGRLPEQSGFRKIGGVF